MNKVMKKDLNIMMGDKPLRLEEGCTIETNEVNPLTSNEPLRSGYFELIGKELPTPVIDHNIRLGV